MEGALAQQQSCTFMTGWSWAGIRKRSLCIWKEKASYNYHPPYLCRVRSFWHQGTLVFSFLVCHDVLELKILVSTDMINLIKFNSLLSKWPSTSNQTRLSIIYPILLHYKQRLSHQTCIDTLQFSVFLFWWVHIWLLVLVPKAF